MPDGDLVRSEGCVPRLVRANSMKLWLTSKWEDLRTSFWFMPTLMVIGAIFLSFFTINLDKVTAEQNRFATLGWTFTRGPEGSRALLSTVAGSMMTIASVTFSITIVALQLASGQFGPRLLRNFMRDQGNQLALGTFIATFTYCLLVLRTVNGSQDEPFVPHISVTIGLLLALMSLGVLIYFIHHAAESIQAENVIAAVSRELHRAINKLYPETVGKEPAEALTHRPSAPIPADYRINSRDVESPESDYLQAIDLEGLLGLAVKHDLILAIDQRPGKFCLKGGRIASAWPSDRVDDGVAHSIQNSFYFGLRRTLTQDSEFAIDQLVEIAVRALSPGINDPFTAINCIDRIGAALGLLTEKEIPSRYRFDDEGRLRVITEVSTVSGIIDASFHQIRQAALGNTSVSLKLMETIAAIARQTRDDDFLGPLRRHADAIHRGTADEIGDPIDRQDADDRYRRAIAAIEGSPRTDKGL